MCAPYLFDRRLLRRLGSFVLVLPCLAPLANGKGPDDPSKLVSPAQQVVFEQPLPAPYADEQLQAPAESPAVPEPAQRFDYRVNLPDSCGCCCTSSICDFYNTDCGCGCGPCNNCAVCRCRCGRCCSRCQQRKRERQAKYWGYPEYFCERPFGSCTHGAVCKMIANGLKDQMVLYEYDFGFGEDAWQLKERGLLQLHKIACRFQAVQAPLVIQASSDPALDAKRQAHVLAALSDLGLPLPEDMVVISRPGTRGLDGVEALPIYSNVLEQTRQRGNIGIDSSALRDIGLGSSAIGAATTQAPILSQ